MKRVLLLIMAMVSAGWSWTDTVYIRDTTGTGISGANCTGVDWAHPLPQWPGTESRSVLYLVAAGTYERCDTLICALNGTDSITYRRATAAAHGTPTGWDDTLGESRTCYIPRLFMRSSFPTIDGVYGGCPDSCDGPYGFNITMHGYTSADIEGMPSGIGCIEAFRNVPTDSGVRHMHVSHTNISVSPLYLVTGCLSGISAERSNSSTGRGYNDSAIIYKSKICGTSNTGISFAGRGWIVDQCRFDSVGHWGETQGFCGQTPGNISHGVGMELYDASGLHVTNCVVSNFERTGFISTYSDAAIIKFFDSVVVAGNVFYITEQWAAPDTNYDGSPDSNGWGGNGVITHNSGSACYKNLSVSNNTFFGFNRGKSLSLGMSVTHLSRDSGNCKFVNNIVYNCSGLIDGYSGTSSEIGYNAANRSISGDGSLQTLTTSIFNDSIDAGGVDFRLTQGTDAGTTVRSPYSIDPDGNERTTPDRGAYEYGGTSPQTAKKYSKCKFIR